MFRLMFCEPNFVFRLILVTQKQHKRDNEMIHKWRKQGFGARTKEKKIIPFLEICSNPREPCGLSLEVKLEV